MELYGFMEREKKIPSYFFIITKDNNKNISEIAYECGYSDLAAMSKAFKKRFGVAPTVYRKKLSGEKGQ